LLLDLIDMKRFEFEARKDVAQVYNFVLRQKKVQAVEYVKQHPAILRALVDGYNDPEIALSCGSILREVIRHEELNELLLNDPNMFDLFFEYVQLSTFDVASDAFATFKVRRDNAQHMDERTEREIVLLTAPGRGPSAGQPAPPMSLAPCPRAFPFSHIVHFLCARVLVCFAAAFPPLLLFLLRAVDVDKAQGSVCQVPGSEFRRFLPQVQRVASIAQLRDETPVAQVAWRTVAQPQQFHHHDALHQFARESQDYDELAQGSDDRTQQHANTTSTGDAHVML
jgi:hypothetical protein